MFEYHLPYSEIRSTSQAIIAPLDIILISESTLLHRQFIITHIGYMLCTPNFSSYYMARWSLGLELEILV